MTNRYQTTGAEGEFEPGSNGQVLRNLVGISSSDDMDELELRLLGELYDEVLLQNLPARALTVADLKYWHRLWLGRSVLSIWARTVSSSPLPGCCRACWPILSASA